MLSVTRPSVQAHLKQRNGSPDIAAARTASRTSPMPQLQPALGQHVCIRAPAAPPEFAQAGQQPGNACAEGPADPAELSGCHLPSAVGAQWQAAQRGVPPDAAQPACHPGCLEQQPDQHLHEYALQPSGWPAVAAAAARPGDQLIKAARAPDRWASTQPTAAAASGLQTAGQQQEAQAATVAPGPLPGLQQQQAFQYHEWAEALPEPEVPPQLSWHHHRPQHLDVQPVQQPCCHQPEQPGAPASMQAGTVQVRAEGAVRSQLQAGSTGAWSHGQGAQAHQAACPPGAAPADGELAGVVQPGPAQGQAEQEAAHPAAVAGQRVSTACAAAAAADRPATTPPASPACGPEQQQAIPDTPDEPDGGAATAASAAASVAPLLQVLLACRAAPQPCHALQPPSTMKSASPGRRCSLLTSSSDRVCGLAQLLSNASRKSLARLCQSVEPCQRLA